MNWSRILTSYFVIAQLVLAPVFSYAGAPELEVQNGQLTDAGKKNAAALSEYAAKMNYDSRVDSANGKMYFIDRESKKTVGEVILRDQKSLMEYSPSTLNKRLSAGIAGLKMANKASMEHAWKSFPVESGAFFLALGGMTAVQLLTNYADNPVGMKQHIEHSLSPVGQLGFFMFMYSQGITSNALSMWMKNPKMGMPIGMLGMTVGMAVQSYFSQVVGDPHIRACAAKIFQNDKSVENACDGAYKYFVLDKKILEGPGIASLLGSFLLITGARMAAGAVLRMVGIELGTLLVPGGVEVKALRWVVTLAVSGANAALFTAVQMKLEQYISYAWKNYFDGKEFVGFNDDLVEKIAAQKKSNWTGKASDLNSEVKDFSKKMEAWRVNNLSDAYGAHQAWSEFLGQLTQMYAASFNFYDTYVPEVLATKDSMIDRVYPLNGVTPKDLSDGSGDHYVNRPDRIEYMQAQTTVDVANMIGQNISSGYYKNMGVLPDQIKSLAAIQAGLANEDLVVKGKAINELNRQFYINSQSHGVNPYLNELSAISRKLGNQPEPLMDPGSGFTASFKYSPSFNETVKGLEFSRMTGLFATANAADFFVVQMMCGPDTSKNEPMISIVKGFPAKFSPPSIALTTSDKDSLCHTYGMTPLMRNAIYKFPAGKKYGSTPEYLRANINPEVSQDFKTWWAQRTEAPMRQAFDGFGKMYKGIIGKLYNGLNETRNSAWNQGLISNGAMNAAFQEIRLYSLILGEMLKDSYKAQHNQALPAEYFNTNLDAKITISAADYMKSEKPLLGLLQRGSRYDFNTLLSANPNADSRSLKIQTELEYQFALMNGLIQKARTQSVLSSAYQDQMKSIEAKLSEFSGLLGVNKDNPAPGLVTLGAEQKALAVTCLELLQSVSQELSMYGNMAGTARYPDSK